MAISLNLVVVLAWLVSWQLGASIDVQTYVVLALSVLVTFVFYKLIKAQQNGGAIDDEGYPQGTVLWHWMCKLGALSHREKGRLWRTLRWLMDRGLFSRRR